ncbi:Hsp70 family protein [Paractinoplanes rishiriensis]|uniref:Uncharacterized protein n=1 Tax=Paractinoplanes rishiriensis TaxID=1050105 RepID=A0A919JU32_9ACTN|nr:Hsp70 family protein [Actinoplanes rishiriensis]GIE94798.1 hypothetical protein Ari01nite_22630 [Actinoplanes rishiriensis]
MQYGLGVDLGTTKTAAAVRVDDRVEVARLGGRRAEIPSLVYVKPDGGLLIGEAAERRGQGEPARLAREFKRRMGDPVPILVGGTPFSAHALTGKLLRHVLDTVSTMQGGPPAALTVTFPANWGPYKREQLDQAIRLADAGPVQLRSEPEAAALQHATARKIAPGETVAVYDLGGGTFDVAVLRRDGDGFVLLGEPEGIEQLGGIDFDEAVFGYVLGVLGSKADGMDPDDPEAVAALARLRRDCVEAKEALSFDTETMIPVALPGLHTRVRLNRSELESMITPSLADTVTATQRALRAAGVTPDQLSAVLLAGGSSRIPLVAQLLSTEFQRPVVADPQPEHSIALGAAVATAAALGGRSPFSAAVPPPRPVPVAREETPAGHLQEANLPRRSGTPAAAAGPAGGAVPVTPGAPGTPVSPAAGVSFSRGAASVPGTAPAPTIPADPAPVSGPPTSSPPISGPPIASAPISGAGAVYGSGGGSGGVPAYGGAAGGPGGGGPGGNGVANGYPAVPVSGAPGPWMPEKSDRRGRTVFIVAAAALAVAVTAGGTTAYLYLNREKPTGSGQTPPASAPASAPASPAQEFPSDPMLIRGDTGGETPPDRVSKVYSFRPGSPERTLLSGTIAGDVLPKWSHKRDQIALTHATDDPAVDGLYVMNSDGSGRRKLVANGGGRVAWSKNDDKIAFMRKVNDVGQIFVVEVATGKTQQLTWSKTLKDDAMWSPDGKTILYWLNKDNIKQVYELEVADPQEPGRRITGPEVGPADDPVYSPDGSKVLFTRWLNRGATADIWVIDRDGTNPRRVTRNPALEMDPTWSPNGEWFAFVRGEFSKPTIVIQRLDGTGETLLTEPGKREGHPAWY